MEVLAHVAQREQEANGARMMGPHVRRAGGRSGDQDVRLDIQPGLGEPAGQATPAHRGGVGHQGEWDLPLAHVPQCPHRTVDGLPRHDQDAVHVQKNPLDVRSRGHRQDPNSEAASGEHDGGSRLKDPGSMDIGGSRPILR